MKPIIRPVSLALGLIVAGCTIGFSIARSMSPVHGTQPAPHANVAAPYSSIANFGVLPVDPPQAWLAVNDKSGQQLGVVPVAPDQAVIVSTDHEPLIEKTDAPYEHGPVRWTITFKP